MNELEKQEMLDLVTLSEFDFEMAHIEADRILCTVLKKNGYDELVELYNKVKKQYT